jgi:hypothetical protein
MVEVVSAEILVEGSRLEHMVSGSEHEEATTVPFLDVARQVFCGFDDRRGRVGGTRRLSFQKELQCRRSGKAPMWEKSRKELN